MEGGKETKAYINNNSSHFFKTKLEGRRKKQQDEPNQNKNVSKWHTDQRNKEIPEKLEDLYR